MANHDLIIPSNISEGSLDMTVRDLLTHMLDKQLDHAVLVIPGVDAQVSVTVANKRKTVEITSQVQRILMGTR